MRDKLYLWGLTAAMIAMTVLVIVDSPPWTWGETEFVGATVTLIGVLALAGLLRGADRFAKTHDMGEARFDQDGKVIKND